MNTVQIKGFSRPGRNKINEDYMRFASLTNGTAVAVLADGMGGLSNGDLAARVTAQTVFDVLIGSSWNDNINDLFCKALSSANEQVNRYCKQLHCRMGAAVTAIAVDGNTAYYSWLGNVRLYVVKDDGCLEQLTEDHIYHAVGCQDIFLTRCVNGREMAERIPTGKRIFNKPTKFYLCSDGFYQSVAEKDFEVFDPATDILTPDQDDDCSLIAISIG